MRKGFAFPCLRKTKVAEAELRRFWLGHLARSAFRLCDAAEPTERPDRAGSQIATRVRAWISLISCAEAPKVRQLFLSLRSGIKSLSIRSESPSTCNHGGRCSICRTFGAQ